MTRAERLVAALLRHAEEHRCRPTVPDAAEFRAYLLAKAAQVAP